MLSTLTLEDLSFNVDGLPPAKSEAKSILSAGHPHADRVRTLLAAAQDALVEQAEGVGFGTAQLGVEVCITYTTTPPAGDTSNYLGGIGDVLEDKGARGSGVEHLGVLAGVAIYDNDRQLSDSRCHRERGDHDGYTVRLWVI